MDARRFETDFHDVDFHKKHGLSRASSSTPLATE